MIVNAWPRQFTEKYGHDFPLDYVSFDTEFTGNSEQKDLVLEIGHTLVSGGKVVDSLDLILNWYDHPEVDHAWLDYKLRNNAHFIGEGWVLTPEYVRSHGISPYKALQFYYKFFTKCIDNNLFFVAQNGITADEKILRGNFNRYLNKSFCLPEDRYFDTGGLFKANQIYESRLGDALNFKSVVLPHRSESLKSYFKRVTGLRVNGVKWSLELILEHYGLLDKHKVKKKDLHSAGYDSLCLHWIMEEYRKGIVCESPVALDTAKPKTTVSSNTQSKKVETKPELKTAVTTGKVRRKKQRPV